MTLAELFETYHDRVAAIVRDDDVMGELWLLLARRPDIVGRVDRRRNVLSYLCAIAWQLRRQRLRALRRRPAHRLYFPNRIVAPAAGEYGRVHELAGHLTRREKQFLFDSLGVQPMPELSASNRWQLASRVRRKLACYATEEFR
jgi:hypothetical protein